MTEKYMFFNSTSDDRRRHKASDMAEYWNSFLTNGIFRESGKLKLGVSVESQTMNVTVSKGRAILDGHLYILEKEKTLEVKAEPVGSVRYDRIILRYDNTIENRYIKLFVKQGDASPPDLVRTKDIYELSLASVKVTGGQTYISEADLTDERLVQGLGGVAIAESASDAMDLVFDDKGLYDSDNVADALEELKCGLSVYRSEFDHISGLFKVVEWKRPDGTLYKKSTLSDFVNGAFEKYTIEKYGFDGIEVTSTQPYRLEYDSGGNLINEVKL